MPVAKGMLKE